MRYNQRKQIYQLVVGDLRPAIVQHKPPSSCANRRTSNVDADDHVTEEKPAADERLLRVARLLRHDVKIGWVEAKGSRWEAIRHEVDPEQLDWYERLRHAKSGSEKDAHNLADV